VTGSMRLGFHAPETVEELAYLIGEAADTRTPIEVMGRGTKREVGRPAQYGTVVSTEGLVGVPLYEPSELILVVLAGTPLAQVEALLAENGQELPFEPVDLGPAFGFAPGQATIGGTIATNICGSRRILVGAARDHVLGVKAVNGHGEVIKAGGRVMKNVTGYDIARALAGSWGTLAIMTEIAIKVLPAQEEMRTLLCSGLNDQTAVEALCLAVGTPFAVSGSVHLHADLAARLSNAEVKGASTSITAIRIESFAASARYRAGRLREMLAAYTPLIELDDGDSRAFWQEIRGLRMFRDRRVPLWRLSTAPKSAARLINSISRKIDVKAMYDWSGGLIWLETPSLTDAGALDIRRTLAEFGGHATLLRASAPTRAGIDVFQPLDPPLAAMTAKLKQAFDPEGILNAGRMYRGV
jgi:glycolate oxidase FAD binding subunit